MNLKKLMEKPLSDSDITKATNGKTNIYTYSDITKYVMYTSGVYMLTND